MNPKAVLIFAATGYVLSLVYFSTNVMDARSLRDRRAAEFAAFSRLIVEVPRTPPPAQSAESLLVRMQRSVDQFGFGDRALKLSGGGNLPVTVGMEGVPFDRISTLLERLSAEPDLATSAFRLERSGASTERFDFSASFTDISAAAHPGAR